MGIRIKLKPDLRRCNLRNEEGLQIGISGVRIVAEGNQSATDNIVKGIDISGRIKDVFRTEDCGCYRGGLQRGHKRKFISRDEQESSEHLVRNRTDLPCQQSWK